MKKSLRTLFSLSIIAFQLFRTQAAYAQKERDRWYFGEFAGLDFNAGSPVGVTGAMDVLEGCSSISNKNGDLLFYTDGRNVWNKYHLLMPNGFGLLGGDSSSTQSSLIIPFPGEANLYYIFTTDQGEYLVPPDEGVRYSLVDMSLDGGKGDVLPSSKNTLLFKPGTEKLTATKHANGCDTWVLAHDWGSNKFYAYLISNQGISIPPVATSIGSLHGADLEAGIGNMKFSPDGSRLAVAIWKRYKVELFNFDNATGVLSNYILMDFENTPIPPLGILKKDFPPYGVEFSPDNSRLFVSFPFSLFDLYTSRLNQYDLNFWPNGGSIKNSEYRVSTSVLGLFGVQAGPDGKIYVVDASNKDHLAVINNPNVMGAGCNYVKNGVDLQGKKTKANLPNYMYDYSNPPKPKPTLQDVIVCDDASAILRPASYPDTDYLWSTSATSDSLEVFTPGIYTVDISNQCYQFTEQSNVSFVKSDPQLTNENLITPNGDNFNDALILMQNQYHEGYHLEIYNRWGDKIFVSSDPSMQWNGDNQSDGVYYYVATIKTCAKEELTFKGTVHLVR
jgi:gliding motility-associated-like protein